MKQIDTFLDFLLFEKGEPVTIGQAPCRALVVTAPRGSDDYWDDKYLRTKCPLKAGTFVGYQEETWLIVSQTEQTAASQRARMRQCNHVTKFVVEDWLYAFPSILEMVSLSVSSTVDIRVATGNMRVILPRNEVTSNIAINSRFITAISAWKVIGLDDTKTGLILLMAEKDLFAPGDDRENEIANADQIPTWRLVVLPEALTLEPGAAAPLAATLYRNDQISANPALLWRCADPAVAHVENGIVTAISEGDTAVTCCWAKHPEIAAVATVSVMAAPPEVVTYAFYSMNEDLTKKTYTEFDVMQGQTKLFGIEKLINGVLTPENDSYTFVFDPNGATASNYTYTVMSDSTVKLTNKLRYTKPVTLTGTSAQSGEELRISFMLRALF